MKKYYPIIILMLITTLLSSCAQINIFICDACGATVCGDKNFCSECGANLYKEETQETTQRITQEVTTEAIENRKLSAVEIYDSISASVVTITAETPQSINSGTGFFYSHNIIITNYHVIEGCSSASVTLPDGRMYKVINVVGYDQSKDIALIQINCIDGKPIPIRNEKIKTGEKVYAIGNSLGFLEGSLSEGIISSAQREINGKMYIQTTASVTHGNSGGPLLDEYGKVVGIVSAGFGEGLDLNLAIPVDEIKTISTSNPLTLYEFSLATTPYNRLYNFIKQNGTESLTGSIRYQFTDKNGKDILQLFLSRKSELIQIIYNVDDDFSIDLTIYPNRSTCDVGATLEDKSLSETLPIAVRGHSLEEVEKSKIFSLTPSSEFEFIFWDGYDEKYYTTWRNYYNNYFDDFFVVYDYYITEIAGLSCDSKVLGFSFAQ